LPRGVPLACWPFFDHEPIVHPQNADRKFQGAMEAIQSGDRQHGFRGDGPVSRMAWLNRKA
jgi:hypothetical protein